MTESPAGYTRRTGRAYDPPESVTRTARALAPDEPCPTLFRFPGAPGLVEWLLGETRALARPDDPLLWAAAAPVNGEAPGAVHFGTLALLQPLRFAMCEAPPEAAPSTGGARGAVFVGANRPLDDGGLVVWVPPSAMTAPIPWERIEDAAAAASWLGAGIDRERGQVVDALDRYAREVEAIARAGLPDAEARWCDRPVELRARLLAEAGVTPVWTGTT